MMTPHRADNHVRARRLRPGCRVIIFGTVSRVVAVESHPAYPAAVLLTLQPAGFGIEVSTLVPADYEPLILAMQ